MTAILQRFRRTALTVATTALVVSLCLVLGATTPPQKRAPVSAIELPDCSERTACLCPWRGVLSLDDFAPVDKAKVPGNVLTRPGQDMCAWHVVETDEGVRVFHTRPDYRRDPKVLPWNPEDAGKPWNKVGARMVVAVSDGFIVARNSGEWGAGIWWLSKDGRKSEQIGSEQVTDLINSPQGVLATTEVYSIGLDKDRGGILQFSRMSEGRWRVTKRIGTETPALCATLEPEGTALVATDNQVLRISSDGKATVLHVGRWSALFEVSRGDVKYLAGYHPNTLLLLPGHGEILIGMSAAIVRLTPGPNGYEETWLTPRGNPR